MLEAILRAAGLRTAAVGNIGRPIMETVLDPEPYDVLAVELSSHQLHWSTRWRCTRPPCSTCRPTTWSGTARFAAYRAAKAKIYTGVAAACVYNVADPATERMVEEAEVVEGARAIGFTLGTPATVDARCGRRPAGRPGVHRAAQGLRPRAGQDHRRAGIAAPPRRTTSRTPWLRQRWPDPSACRPRRSGRVYAGRAGGAQDPDCVAERDGVRFVDDSKATNPHAADAALRAFDPVVWIAGGQAKGTDFDDLVRRHRQPARGAVLLGVDRAVIADSLARHAPDVPVKVDRRDRN